MQVRRTEAFELAVERELDPEGRPSRDDFDRLADAAELTIRAFWGDPTLTPLMFDDSDIRGVLSLPVPPGKFPPGVFLARPNGEDVDLIGVRFQWDYWDQVGGPYEPGD